MLFKYHVNLNLHYFVIEFSYAYCSCIEVSEWNKYIILLQYIIYSLVNDSSTNTMCCF